MPFSFKGSFSQEVKTQFYIILLLCSPTPVVHHAFSICVFMRKKIHGGPYLFIDLTITFGSPPPLAAPHPVDLELILALISCVVVSCYFSSSSVFVFFLIRPPSSGVFPIFPGKLIFPRGRNYLFSIDE